MKNIFQKLIISVIIFSITVISPISAYDKDFYSANDILFYNSDDTSFCGGTDININYSATSAENQEIVAKFLTSTNFDGNNNQPMNAVQMAAILGNIQQESGFDPNAVNELGYKGIVQWGTGRWALIPEVKTDLQNQMNFIKTELDRSDYKSNVGNFWNISDFKDIDEATYLIARNYEVAVQNGASSSDTIWSDDTNASKYVQNWTNRRDYARDLYNKFSGLAGSSSTCAGMTIDQIKAYIEKYENSNGLDLYAPTTCHAYDNNTGIEGFESKRILANCVAVIVYFIQNNTTLEHISPLGNGGYVVDTLLKNGFSDGGNTPMPYAIFSTFENSSDPTVGHTGLVLGVEGDTVYTFEEGCSEPLTIDGGSLGLKTYSMKAMQASDYRFAYPPNGVLINL